MSTDFQDFEPEPVHWTLLRAKFPGRCITCGDWIVQGEMAEWATGVGIRHVWKDDEQYHQGCIVLMPDGSWRYAG